MCVNIKRYDKYNKIKDQFITQNIISFASHPTKMQPCLHYSTWTVDQIHAPTILVQNK